MKKFIALVLAILLSFSLVGCGDKDKFVGTWESEVDYTDFLVDSMSEYNEELAGLIEISEVKLKFVFEFKEDGTYKTYLDETALNSTVESLKREYSLGMWKYFEKLIEGQALNMTVDEVLAENNITIDDLVNEVLGEQKVDEWKEAAQKEGNFKAKNGKLYLSDGVDYSIDTEKYETYEFSGDTIRILGSVNGEKNEENLGVKTYPMILKLKSL